jgi:hypothetical protein
MVLFGAPPLSRAVGHERLDVLAGDPVEQLVAEERDQVHGQH